MKPEEKKKVLDNLSEIRTEFERETFSGNPELKAMAADAYIKVYNSGIPHTEDPMPDGRDEIRKRLKDNL